MLRFPNSMPGRNSRRSLLWAALALWIVLRFSSGVPMRGGNDQTGHRINTWTALRGGTL